MALSTTNNRVSYLTDGTTTVFSFPNYFLANTDLVVILRDNTLFTENTLVLGTDFTVSGAGNSAGGSITTAIAQPSGFTISIYRNPPQTQLVVLVENDQLPVASVEMELDKLTMLIQRLNDQITRSVVLSSGYPANTFNLTLPNNLAPGTVFVVNPGGNGLSAGPVASDIANAEANALAAAASASAASASQSAALSSQNAAALSAASAAAQLASAFFRDTIYKSHADSPLTIDSTYNGKSVVFDTSGGAIIVNLPQINSVTLPFNLAFKIDVAGNTVTINRAGSDVIDASSTNVVLSGFDAASLLFADAHNSPNQWQSLPFGQQSTNNVQSVSSNYTALFTDALVLCNATSAGFNVTLPTPTTYKEIVIKKTDSTFNAVTVVGTIDGISNKNLTTQNDSIKLIWNGSNWTTAARTNFTPWTSYTPTGAWNTNSTYAGKWRRVGDSIQVNANVTLSGAPNNAQPTFSLPSGLTIDTTKLVQSNVATSDALLSGTASIDAGGNAYFCQVMYNNTTSVLTYAEIVNATYGQLAGMTNNIPVAFGNTFAITVNFEVPIVGWDAQ